MLWMFLGVFGFALAMNVEFIKLGCHWRRWLGVFIASNHFLAVGCFCWRWAHRTVRWRTRHVLFIVRCVPRQHARWVLEHSTVEVVCPVVAPDSPVPLTSLLWLLLRTVHCGSRPLAPGYRWLTGHVRCTSDSLVIRARPEKTREWLVRLVLDLVHRTVSGASLTSHSQVLCSKFIWVLNCNFFLGLCWTLCTWDK
jgi:hypothetical protein